MEKFFPTHDFFIIYVDRRKKEDWMLVSMATKGTVKKETAPRQR